MDCRAAMTLAGSMLSIVVSACAVIPASAARIIPSVTELRFMVFGLRTADVRKSVAPRPDLPHET
jgi:hypothetical protein